MKTQIKRLWIAAIAMFTIVSCTPSLPDDGSEYSLTINVVGKGKVVGARTSDTPFTTIVGAIETDPTFEFKGYYENDKLVTRKKDTVVSINNIRIWEARFSNECEVVVTSNTDQFKVTGTGKYPIGTSVTLTIEEISTQWTFFSWMENGKEISKNKSITFVIEKNKYIELVMFNEAQGFKLSAIVQGKGSVEPVWVKRGQNGMLVPKAEKGWVFYRWRGLNETHNNKYIVQNIQEPITITAEFLDSSVIAKNSSEYIMIAESPLYEGDGLYHANDIIRLKAKNKIEGTELGQWIVKHKTSQDRLLSERSLERWRIGDATSEELEFVAGAEVKGSFERKFNRLLSIGEFDIYKPTEISFEPVWGEKGGVVMALERSFGVVKGGSLAFAKGNCYKPGSKMLLNYEVPKEVTWICLEYDIKIDSEKGVLEYVVSDKATNYKVNGPSNLQYSSYDLYWSFNIK